MKQITKPAQRRGRPLRSDDYTTRQVKIRTTYSEYQQIMKKAIAEGMTQSEYIRTRILA